MNELCERVMSTVAVGSISAVNFSVVPLFSHGIEPVCGYAELRKQRKRPQ